MTQAPQSQNDTRQAKTAFPDSHNLRPTPAFPARSRAQRQAGRHSTWVRVFKWGIVLGSLLAVVGVGLFLYFDPFAKPAVNVTISKTTLDGSKVTMEAPRLSGFRSDGRPYDLRAKTGVQDLTKPGMMDLSEIDATFTTTEQGKAHIAAPKGTYDSGHDRLNLLGTVSVTSEQGYDIRLNDADFNFKDGTVTSPHPVTVLMSNGQILADRLDMGDKGERITFDGNVRSTFAPIDAEGNAQDKTEAKSPASAPKIKAH